MKVLYYTLGMLVVCFFLVAIATALAGETLGVVASCAAGFAGLALLVEVS